MELDPTGMPVDIEGVQLVTPGLGGTAEVHYGSSESLRSVELTTPRFAEALDATELTEQLTVVIREPIEVPGAETVPTRSTSTGVEGIEVTVPGPGTGLGQFLLAVAENGALSWHLASAEDGAPDRAGGAPRTYVVARHVAPADAAAPARGFLGAVAVKLLKVITFKLTDEVAGAVGDYFVRRWEQQRRPHRLRTITPSNIADPNAPDASAADLQALRDGRALLFVHGTGSRTESAFAAIPPALLDRLAARYAGGILGFDHPTVGFAPTENTAWLADRLAAEVGSVDIDVVAHSRGGLVARTLIEGVGDSAIPPDRIRVGTSVFVGTPNSGTALAGFDRLGQLVDRLTNLLELAPDNPITDPLAVLLTVVKQLAVGALKGLEGLTCMTPGGEYLRALNAPCDASATYRAVTADFEPTPGSSLATIARDAGTDLIFEGVDNDLVVPTDGVFAGNGSSLFPIDEPVVLDASAGINHSGFWPHPEVVAAFDRWLTG